MPRREKLSIQLTFHGEVLMLRLQAQGGVQGCVYKADLPAIDTATLQWLQLLHVRVLLAARFWWQPT